MIKTKKIIQRIEETEITKVTCDWCGKPFDKVMAQHGGYGALRLIFGYGSDYDDNRYIAEICDKCFDKHLKSKMRQGERDEAR